MFHEAEALSKTMGSLANKIEEAKRKRAEYAKRIGFIGQPQIKVVLA
jgi:hypothetical protein